MTAIPLHKQDSEGKLLPAGTLQIVEVILSMPLRTFLALIGPCSRGNGKDGELARAAGRALLFTFWYTYRQGAMPSHRTLPCARPQPPATRARDRRSARMLNGQGSTTAAMLVAPSASV